MRTITRPPTRRRHRVSRRNISRSLNRTRRIRPPPLNKLGSKTLPGIRLRLAQRRRRPTMHVHIMCLPVGKFYRPKGWKRRCRSFGTTLKAFVVIPSKTLSKLFFIYIIKFFPKNSVFRCTLNAIPKTSSLLEKSRLPFGIHLQPFRDLSVSVLFLDIFPGFKTLTFNRTSE